MKKKMGTMFVKRIMSLVLVCTLCSSFFVLNSSAATKKWSLCRTNGPSSEWVTSYKYSFTTVKSTTKVSCERVGGGAKIHVISTNGISCNFTRAGSVKTSTAKGYTCLVKIDYVNKGTSYNNPRGELIY